MREVVVNSTSNGRSSIASLRKGSRVAVVSPAAAAKAELVELGVEGLRAFGYDPVVMPHALTRGPLYYAGTAEQRVADLHAAFADKGVDGIICTRGGWGSAELLPLLDVELIRENPKVFVGYSDQTSLHVWLWNECGLSTFHAPMVAADWAKSDGVDERTWRAAVRGLVRGVSDRQMDCIHCERVKLREDCWAVVCRFLRQGWVLHGRCARRSRACCFWRTLGRNRMSGIGCYSICDLLG